MWAPNFSVTPTDPTGSAIAVLPGSMAVAGADGRALSRVKLVPYGTFYGTDRSGPFVLTGKSQAHDVIAATRQFQRGAGLVFDYDHQTVLAPQGSPLIAGSIAPDSLIAEADGIYATVDWTPVGELAVQRKEYQYHEAHVRAMKGTGQITRITGAGLTNTSNLDVRALNSVQSGIMEHAPSASLTADELRACEMTGVSPEVFMAMRDGKVALASYAARLTPDETRACEMTGMKPETFIKARERESVLARARGQF